VWATGPFGTCSFEIWVSLYPKCKLHPKQYRDIDADPINLPNNFTAFIPLSLFYKKKQTSFLIFDFLAPQKTTFSLVMPVNSLIRKMLSQLKF
jgi:hypothetical protein